MNNDTRECSYVKCSNSFTPIQPHQSFCSSACRKNAHKHRKRTAARASKKSAYDVKKIQCARYGCERLFVPKSVNNRFCSSSCQEQARQDRKLLEQLTEEPDPAVVRAAENELVKEYDRQVKVLMRRLLKEETRSAQVLSAVEDWLNEHPRPRFEVYKPRTMMKPGKGSPTDAHFLFSDPQGGKWEQGIGLKVLLEEYMPVLVEKIIRCVEVQRFEGPVDDFFLHLGGDIVEGCLPAGSVVTTLAGPKYIEDIQANDWVWAHGDDGFKPRRVLAQMMTGIKPVHTIDSTERTLRASPEHPVLIRRDVEVTGHPSPNRWRYEVEHMYVPASEVKEGDYLCILDRLPEEGETTLPDGQPATVEMMEFLGFYLGDGCLLKGPKGEPRGVFLAHDTDAPYMSHYKGIAQHLFTKNVGRRSTRTAVAVEPKPASGSSRFGSTAAGKQIAALGFGGIATTKRVPAWVFGLTADLRRAFLRGYLDADGTVNELGQMIFASVNRGLIEDIQTLCMGLGLITSRIKAHTRTCPLPQGGSQESTIYVVNCDAADLNATVGSHTPLYLSRWEARKGTRRKRNYPVTDKRRIPTAPAGCRYSLVRSNTVGLAEPVYNIEVDDLHTFVADGVVTHNCKIYPGQRNNLDRYLNGNSSVDQVLAMSDAIADILIARLRPYFRRFIVANAYGNHGRTGTKSDPSLGKDNYDRLIAEILRRMCGHMDVEWVIPERDRYVVQSKGWRIGGIHGDQLGNKNSLNAMELPVLRWDAIQWFGERLDVLLMGHRHHPASLDVQGIELIQNGAIDGGSEHYTNTAGGWSAPSQELFFVSAEYGVGTRRRLYVRERRPRAISESVFVA